MTSDPLAQLRVRLVRARRRATSTALAPFVRVVAAPLWEGARPGRRYWADCYRRASDYVLAHAAGDAPIAGPLLVHGVCRNGRMLWAHAWAELPGALVFDGVRQQFYERDGYYRVLQATAEATYSVTAMVEQMRASHSFGPWHDGALGRDSARPTAGSGTGGDVGYPADSRGMAERPSGEPLPEA